MGREAEVVRVVAAAAAAVAAATVAVAVAAAAAGREVVVVGTECNAAAVAIPPGVLQVRTESSLPKARHSLLAGH